MRNAKSNDRYPYEMGAICKHCKDRYGSHYSGTKPKYWCPPHPPEGHEDDAPYFEPIHTECKYPLPPTAEQIYEALRGD